MASPWLLLLLYLGSWSGAQAQQVCADTANNCLTKAQRDPNKCNKRNFQTKCPVTCRVC